MYTIKFGENTLRILSDIGAFSFKKIGKNKAVVYNYTKARKLIDLIREVTYSTIKNHIILFIFRNGKWDLPKGKIEANETNELGAVREVEEECGIKISKLKGKIDVTYHTYLLDNKHILKSNHWFLMHADSNQKLIPQAEENIEKVEWKKKDEIDRLLENSYDSIRELMELYKKDFKKDL